MKDILTAIGASETKMPYDTENWTFYTAVFQTPAGAVTGHYLYLKSRCPLHEASRSNIRIWETAAGGRGYHIAMPPGSDLAKDPKATGKLFQGIEAYTTREFLRRQILANQDLREIQREPHFIPPDLRTEQGTEKQNAPNELSFWFRQHQTFASQNQVGILCAHAGTGKTTMARQLAFNLQDTKSGIFPLLIESDQWSHLLNIGTSLTNIWEQALSRSLRRPGAILGNDQLFRTLVKEGLFPIIFDGLDELCLHPNSSFSPEQVIDAILEDLIQTDEDSNARVLLTTRDSFWKTFGHNIDKARVDVFHLLGFSNEQKKRYFITRFPNDQPRLDYALRLSKNVATLPELAGGERNAERISGTPFILSLIAEACESEEFEENISNPYEGDQLDWLIKSICRRENTRQKLNIEPGKQIELFEEVFHLCDNTIRREELIEYTSLVCDLNPDEIPPGLFSHFFLVTEAEGIFRPKYDVLRAYFIARYLAYGLSGVRERSGRGDIARILAHSSAGTTQVMDWVLQLFSRLKQENPQMFTAAVKKAVDILHDGEHKIERRPGLIALSNLVQRLLDSDEKEEKTKHLIELLSKNSTYCAEMCFEGQTKGFSFSVPLFDKCYFRNVQLRACQFGQQINFTGCIFEGSLDFGHCVDEVKVGVDGTCLLSKEAEVEFSRVMHRAPRNDVMRDLAGEALEKALNKFKGRFGFESVVWQNRMRGIAPANPFRERVWDELISGGIIEKHLIANVSGGGLNVSENAEIRREIWRFFDNGVFGSRIRKVLDRLAGEK